MAALLALACCFAVASCSRSAPSSAAAEVKVKAELRSWVVVGRGRHLYLQIEAPPPNTDVSGRVEYTMVTLRSDYDPRADASGAPRLGRYRGPGHLRPPDFAPPPDNRLEATYILTIDQARCIQRDRIFEEPYILVGPNSNAGLRAAMESCGVPLPDRIKSSGGLLGEFPGIDFKAGDEIPRDQWRRYGLEPL